MDPFRMFGPGSGYLKLTPDSLPVVVSFPYLCRPKSVFADSPRQHRRGVHWVNRILKLKKR